MNLKTFQRIADKTCKQFRIKKVEVIWNERCRRRMGFYRQDIIEITPNHPDKQYIDTLLHELGHHLKKERYRLDIPGYFQEIFWNARPVKTEIEGGPHDKLFKQCFKEIKYFHYGIAKRKKDSIDPTVKS